MSTTDSISNVYYLTRPALAAEGRARPSRGSTMWLRLRVLWWRLRLTTVEVVATARRFGRGPAGADTTFLEQHAHLILAGERRPAGPARIIDFAAARTRLRA